MLAGVAAGLFTDLHEAALRAVRIAEQPVAPRPETRDVYEEAYQAYRRLFDGLEAARL
jgi:xylulokinase